MKLSLFLQILSELSVNLSAGWFGSIFIVPNFLRARGKKRIALLTLNFLWGIVALMTAYALRIVL